MTRTEILSAYPTRNNSRRARANYRCPYCETEYYWIGRDECTVCGDELLVQRCICAECGKAIWEDEAVGYDPQDIIKHREHEWIAYCEDCADKCPWCERYLPRTQFKEFEGEEMCLDCIRATIEERER